MSDGSLSQDEIDALLQGSGGMDIGGAPEPSAVPDLSDAELKAFRAVVKDTVEAQKSNMATLVGKDVRIADPKAQMMSQDEFISSVDEEMVQITLNYSDGAPGAHSYLLSEDAAVKIATPLIGQDGIEIDEATLSALQEAFSQISGPVVTALSEKASVSIMTDPPGGEKKSTGGLEYPDGEFACLSYRVSIEGERPFDLYEIYDAQIVKAIAGGAAPQAGQQQMAGGPQQQADPFAGFGGGQMGGQVGGAPQYQQPYQNPGQMGGQMGGGPPVQPVQFPNLQMQGASQEQGNIGLLMDVYMELTVELGRTRKLIKEILGFGEGTIIELDKLAGEPVDILVNHKLIAKGEVVVIDENFGVRITEIVSTMERLSTMA